MIIMEKKVGFWDFKYIAQSLGLTINSENSVLNCEYTVSLDVGEKLADPPTRTEIVRKWAKENNVEIIEHPEKLRDPVDFKGLPFIDELSAPNPALKTAIAKVIVNYGKRKAKEMGVSIVIPPNSCDRCGQDWSVHNDDGSCVED